MQITAAHISRSEPRGIVRRFALLLLLAALLPCGSCGGRNAEGRRAQQDVEAVVLRVADGDSLVVSIPSFPPIVGEKITVRLAGCDTAEKNDSRPEERALAEEARRLTESMAPPGSAVVLRNIRRDKYFRLLADVEASGGDIAGELLRRRLAVPYSGGTKNKGGVAAALRAAEVQ